MAGVVVPLHTADHEPPARAELRRAIARLGDVADGQDVVPNLRAGLVAIRQAVERASDDVDHGLVTRARAVAMRAAPVAERFFADRPDLALWTSVATEGGGSLLRIAFIPEGVEMPSLLVEMRPVYLGALDAVIESLTDMSAPIAPAA